MRKFIADLSFAKVVESLDLDLMAKQKLSNNLRSIVEGREDILLTPMAKENGTSKLISEFNKVFDAERLKCNKVLLDLEDSNKAKLGPRSIAIPWSERSNSLEMSFDAPSAVGFTKLNGNLGKPVLRPLSLDKALTLLKNNTNSGLPYFTKKGIVKQRTLIKFDELLKRRDPCVLFTRTQEQNKTRNVWGYPMADTLNEMMYYSPLLNYQRKLAYRAALNSPDEVGRRILTMFDKSKLRKLKFLSIDFSSYDTYVRGLLLDAAFDYIKSLYQPMHHKELDYIAERFRSIGIVTPSGVMKGLHGIPSGSTFTNEVGSIVQAIIALSIGIDVDRIQIQGDDGVYLLTDDEIQKLIAKFESFGLVVNKSKSYTSDEYCIFLQCLYHKDYMSVSNFGGIYPVYRALNRIMYQERWSDFEDFGISGKDFYSIRTICIVENCKYHPLFETLIKFVLKWDKYSLVVTDQGLNKYVQMLNQTKGAGEILNNQFGDDVSGIRSFKTVKIIQSLG